MRACLSRTLDATADEECRRAAQTGARLRLLRGEGKSRGGADAEARGGRHAEVRGLGRAGGRRGCALAAAAKVRFKHPVARFQSSCQKCHSTGNCIISDIRLAFILRNPCTRAAPPGSQRRSASKILRSPLLAGAPPQCSRTPSFPAEHSARHSEVAAVLPAVHPICCRARNPSVPEMSGLGRN